MKHLLFLFLSLSTLFSADLPWLHDYDKAIKQAKEQNKMVYLFVGADDCKWCDRFKDMTLSKDEVIKRLEKEYVLLYMSRDRHNIPKKFEVQGVPRHYFLSSKGKVIHEDRGSREPDGFFTLLEEVELKN